MRFARRPRAFLSTVALTAGGGVVLATLSGAGPATAASHSAGAPRALSVNCPDVASRLPAVPAKARAEVDRNLMQLNIQIQEANNRLVTSAGEGGPDFAQNAVLGPLRDKRLATINRIATAIGRVAERPAGLDALAACTLNGAPNAGAGQGGGTGNGMGNGGEQGNGEQQLRPVASDFIDIRRVRPNVRRPKVKRGGSRGTFTSRCGRNKNGHYNSDNFITAPGVVNGAHHTHDYVGNKSTDGFSTDESLARAGTTCKAGDKSTYFWPVLRLRSPNDPPQNDQSAADLNVGRIQVPASVKLEFRGNPRAKVTAMPRFMRVITGDAKAATNGPANARAAWTCSGFTDRVVTDKYPICPKGSRLTRILDFPSCWDGRNTDSANHRTHVVFPRANGACPRGTRPVPQLRMTISYKINLTKAQIRKGRVYALDSFPEQLHNPITDHGDFVNVMPRQLMRFAVFCINSGKRC